MAFTCSPSLPDGAFISGLLNYIDCQAQSIGEGGYQALASSGSSISLALGGMMSIFIALIGYRMIFGQTPGTQQVVMIAVKIGLVLTLATSWAAYRTLFYEVTMHGPAELASQIGGSANIPGSTGGLVWQLQRTDNGWIELGRLGVGRPQTFGLTAQRPPAQGGAGQQGRPQAGQTGTSVQQFDQSLDRAADASALRYARTFFLIGTVGAFALVRMLAGLLLALGPLFALFLLFDATRDLFDGWVRALAWTIFAALSVTLIVGVELAFLDPWLATTLALRRADLPSTANPSELLAFSMIFMVATFAVPLIGARLTNGFSMAAPSRWLSGLRNVSVPPQWLQRPEGVGHHNGDTAQRSRALHLADSVASMQRREAPPGGSRPGQIAQRLSSGPETRAAVEPAVAGLAQKFRRRTRSRVSVSANQRDGRL